LSLRDVAVVFLAGRECPWRCTMCDLWRQTTSVDTPPGAIVHQIAAAVSNLNERAPATSVIKLYNAGSFFDPRAVPEADYAAIVECLRPFSRVIVESHPALIGPRLDRFLQLLRSTGQPGDDGSSLEVAMGLETAHPDALQQLNKRMDVPAFTRAAHGLRERAVALRVFLLISPPFIAPEAQDEWLLRSIDVALACGASAISLIPTRGGNGTMELLQETGAFQPPSLDTIERSGALALRHAAGRARIFVDLWDLETLTGAAGDARIARLKSMNRQQRLSIPA
jgi:archaeosine synthase beta-subunit